MVKSHGGACRKVIKGWIMFWLNLSHSRCSYLVSGRVATYVHPWLCILTSSSWIYIVGLVVTMDLSWLHSLV